MPARRTTPTTIAFNWLVSLLFWACLLIAVGLYGVTVLSPKLVSFLELDQEYRENQVRLVRMEQQVEYFNKVAGALEKDPAFASELARIEFNATRPGEERIAVDQRLSLQAPQPPATNPEAVAALPWYVSPVKTFVDNEDHRNLMLAGAAALVILAFTFLQESPASTQVRRRARG
jgi:hypothetical protein